MATSVNTEDVIGKKYDKCFTDSIVKFGGGAALGVVFSVLFFKRKSWPIIMGSGVGLGVAYNRCESSINEVFKPPILSGKASKISDPVTGEIIKDK